MNNIKVVTCEPNNSISSDSISTEEVKSFYNGLLPVLVKDHERPNPRLERFKFFIKEFNLQGKNVLDLGCGTGITSKFIAEQRKYK